jgi:hypothetical protein
LRNAVAHTDSDSDRDWSPGNSVPNYKSGNTDTFAFSFTRRLLSHQRRA